MQLLILLAAVLTSSLVAATAQNDESGQCVSRKEFDTLKEELARSRQETAAVKGEVDSWQNSTIFILKQYLFENPRDVRTELQQIKDELTQVKQEMKEEYITTRNASQEESTTLQQQLLQYMQSLEQRIVQEQNRTLQEMARLLSQNTIQNFPNGTFQNPAPSCKYIEQGTPSGYYWIQRPTTGYASQVYCNLTRRYNSTGGWMRVAYLNMTNSLTTCPPGFRQISSPKRTCGRTQQSAGCSSVSFSSHGIAYSKVCGQIIGYQDGSPSGFYTPSYAGSSIEGPYLEGVSVTHGRSPRKHIWSFANALQEAYGFDNNRHVCPCRPSSTMQHYIPSFVGNDYFCDTGIQDNWRSGVFYPDDPLWDGQGCSLQPDCCRFNSPPWFCKKLSYSTTDDIEVRICADQGYRDEDSPIELIEIYVQ